MTGVALPRKGWCPGARRPMPAKDGLLVRLRISGGAVAAATMRGIARAGRAHGNGRFDLSNRGNLQIRGVRESRLPALIETLDELSLIDANATAEAVRNILLSPLAGLDGRRAAPEAAKALETTLAANMDLHALPGKFGFLIDDGGALSLDRVPADIRFGWNESQHAFAIGIGGRASEAIFLGHCSGADIPAIAVRLGMAFLRLGSAMAEPPRRMRNLIADCGAHTLAKAAGLGITAVPPKPGFSEDPCPIGLMRYDDKSCFGAGAAFGSLDADMLGAAANAAENFGMGEIRLTPWRALILPHVQDEQAGAMSAYFARHGFIANRKDARLAIAACGGESTCEQGTTKPRADALALMFLARKLCKTGVALHVSGCAKGCALQAPAPLTLDRP